MDNVLGVVSDEHLKHAGRVIIHMARKHANVVTIDEINNVEPGKYDLIVLFGPTVSKKLLGGGIKLIDARLDIHHVYETPAIVTWDAGVFYTATWMAIDAARDILWAYDVLENGWREYEYVSYSKPPVSTTISVDIETQGVYYDKDGGKIVSIAIADEDGAYVQYGEKGPALERLLKCLEWKHYLIIGHNIKYDLNWILSRHPVKVRARIWDTEICAYVIQDDLTDNRLAYHASRLRFKPYKRMVDIEHMADEDPETVKRYNAIDAWVTYQLYKHQKTSGHGIPMTRIDLFEFLCEMVPVFSAMETRGVLIDQDKAAEQRRKLEEQRDHYRSVIGHEDLNLNSPASLRKLLYERLQLPILQHTEKGQPSTDKTTLHQLVRMLDDEHVLRDAESTSQLLRAILRWRRATKLLSTYLDKLPEYIAYDGCIHTRYSLARSQFGGTVTGRTSSRDPNLQNIPRSDSEIQLRSMFIARPGYKWWDADYSALEMRVVCDLADEPCMREIFDRDLDFHTATLAQQFGVPYEQLVDILSDPDHKDYYTWKARRTVIKNINFGILYGVGPTTLALLCSIAGAPISKHQASEMIERWLGMYGAIRRWLQKNAWEARKNGCLTSPLGRVRHLPSAGINNAQAQRQIRQGNNFLVQSVASDITLIAIYNTHKYLSSTGIGHVLLNVHDQQAGEIREDCADTWPDMLQKLMIDQVVDELKVRFGYSFKVPLKIDINISNNWR